MVGGVGGESLDTDHLSMRQIVLGYMLPTTPPEYNGRGGGGDGLDSDHPSMRQVVLGYKRVTSSRVSDSDPDPT